jgi:hypothetical protein
MRSTLLVLSAVLTMSTGCSTLQGVNRTQSEEWIGEARRDLVGREAVVRMIGDREYGGRILTFYTNSLSLHIGARAPIVHLALDSIQSIQPTLNISLSLGWTLGGAVLGAAIGTNVAANGYEGSGGFDEGIGKQIEGALFGAVIGGLVLGIGVGSLTSMNEYRFLPGGSGDEAARSKPTVPDSLKTK